MGRDSEFCFQIAWVREKKGAVNLCVGIEITVWLRRAWSHAIRMEPLGRNRADAMRADAGFSLAVFADALAVFADAVTPSLHTHGNGERKICERI